MKDFYLTSEGYLIKGAPWYSHAQGMHRVEWERHVGPIPEGMIVHHKNGIKTDNRIENLELVTLSEHQRIHAGWLRNHLGEFTHKPCCSCRRTLPLFDFYINRKSGGWRPVCKQCAAADSRRRLEARRPGARRNSGRHIGPATNAVA